MTPLKETLEVATSVAEATSTQVADRTKADSGHLRSDAVSLDVPVKVHGSRVTEVVRGITPHSEPFEEKTSTMIVFPQGGVLRMSTPVTAGQMVVLTNLKSGHDAICRVVKVRACAPTQSYVELEFTNRQQGYWGVHFAADEVEPVRQFVPPPPPPLAAETEIVKPEVKPAPQISWAPAAAMQQPPARYPEPAPFQAPVKTPSPQPGKPESSFVGIGSQEEVQPAASATVIKTKTQQRSVAPSVPVSMAELRGDAHAAPPAISSLGAGVPGEMTDLSDALAESSQQEPPATFGRLAASTSLSGGHSAPEKAFGARFDSSAMGVSEYSSEPRKESGPNWFLVAAGIAAIFVVGVGGAAYFHMLPGAKSPTRSAAVSAPVPEAPSVISPAETSAAPLPVSNPVAQISQPATAATVNSPAVAVHVDNVPASKVSQVSAPAPAQVQPSAPVNQRLPSRVADISGALSAHPVSAQRSASGDAEPAPSVDAGAAAPGSELEGISTSSAVPPPPAPAEAPIHVGGDVKPPKLTSTVLPTYPSIARSSGIEGSVVVDTAIDAAGNVTTTKVISGPAMLRQAAVDALRRWKYSPATLNGEPIAVHITVTINFHR